MPLRFSEWVVSLRKRNKDIEILLPGDPGYNQSRLLWNPQFDFKPAAIVKPRTEDDVVSCVRLCKQHSLRISIKGGGCRVSTPKSATGDVLIELSYMDTVEVDFNSMKVTVGGGATWKKVHSALEGSNIGLICPYFSDIGVAGATLVRNSLMF